MSASLSRAVVLACAVLLVGTASASARPKKHSAPPASAAAATTMCYGTPIIMQGVDCQKRVAGAEEPPVERMPRPRLTARGSSGRYIAPLQPMPSLNVPQVSAAPYIPPPVANPSDRINQLNQSFPFNAGLGNNPTDRDAYIRYNMTR